MRGERAWMGLVGVAMLVVEASSAGASCRLAGDQLGSAVGDSLRREPRTLLLQYPHGEAGLRGMTAQLAAAGADTLGAVLSVVGSANNPQRQAIGAGLAAALNTCSMQDSDLAQKIRRGAKGSGSSALVRAFNMAIDTSSASSAGPDAVAKTAMPTSGLAPTIGGDLAFPKSRGTAGLADPRADPAAWH